MPATALDLLTLERARFELRFPDGDTSQDNDLRELIKSAVQIVQKDLNIPLIDTSVYTVRRMSSDFSIVFADGFLKAVTSVKYQAPPDNGQPTPGVYPDIVDAGAYTVDMGSPGIVALDPVGDWPEAAFRRAFIQGTYGIRDSDPRIDTFRAAAVLAFRSLYDGVTIVREEDAYTRIIRTLINYSPWQWTAE